MLTYRHVWVTLAGGLTTVGLVAGLVAWAPVAVLTFLLLATVVAAGTASITCQEGQGLPWRRAARTGLLTAAMVVGAGGIIDLLGTWGFALVVTTAVGLPARRGLGGPGERRARRRGAAHAAPQPRVDAWLAGAHADLPCEPGASSPRRSARRGWCGRSAAWTTMPCAWRGGAATSPSSGPARWHVSS